MHAPQLGTVKAVKGNEEAAGLLAFRHSLGLTMKYHLLAPGVLSSHINSCSSAPTLFSHSHFYLYPYLFVQFCLWTPEARDYRLWVGPNKIFFKTLSISETWLLLLFITKEHHFVNTNCLEVQIMVVLQRLVKKPFQEANKFHIKIV